VAVVLLQLPVALHPRAAAPEAPSAAWVSCTASALMLSARREVRRSIASQKPAAMPTGADTAGRSATRWSVGCSTALGAAAKAAGTALPGKPHPSGLWRWTPSCRRPRRSGKRCNAQGGVCVLGAGGRQEWNAGVELLKQRREQLSAETPTVCRWRMELNSGEAAGQTVVHAHWHRIHRRVGKGGASGQAEGGDCGKTGAL